MRGLTAAGDSCSTLEMERCLPSSHRWIQESGGRNKYDCRVCGARGYLMQQKMIVRANLQERA